MHPLSVPSIKRRLVRQPFGIEPIRAGACGCSYGVAAPASGQQAVRSQRRPQNACLHRASARPYAANYVGQDTRNWALRIGIEVKTNPMQLRDVKSIKYEERTRNKPNPVIHNYINMLRDFWPDFRRNMNDISLTLHSRFAESSMASIGYKKCFRKSERKSGQGLCSSPLAKSC